MISGRSFLRPVVALALIVSAYSVLVLLSAKNGAERIAGSKPYCIQVATERGYRKLSTSLQLAGFYMRGDGPMNHAVLVVGPPASSKLYHWSYYTNRFEPGAYGDPPIYCEPTVNFFETLDQHDDGEKANILSLRFRGYRFDIPESYDPRPYWPSNNVFVMAAHPPTFEPRGPMQPSAVPDDWVEVTRGIDVKLTGGQLYS